MILKVTAKHVYGNQLLYPACDRSAAFLKALGLKTFTSNALDAARALGFTFEAVSVAVAI